MSGYSQWVGSEKLRKDVGWSDKKSDLHQYRLASEIAAANGYNVSASFQSAIRCVSISSERYQTMSRYYRDRLGTMHWYRKMIH